MFALEDRYVVIKRKDIDRYLSKRDITELSIILEKIEFCRVLDGRRKFNSVVIENDWGCYHKAIELIKEEANGAC